MQPRNAFTPSRRFNASFMLVTSPPSPLSSSSTIRYVCCNEILQLVQTADIEIGTEIGTPNDSGMGGLGKEKTETLPLPRTPAKIPAPIQKATTKEEKLFIEKQLESLSPAERVKAINKKQREREIRYKREKEEGISSVNMPSAASVVAAATKTTQNKSFSVSSLKVVDERLRETKQKLLEELRSSHTVPKKKTQKKEHVQRTIFVKNVHVDTSIEVMKEEFSKFGQIKKIEFGKPKEAIPEEEKKAIRVHRVFFSRRV